MEQKKFIGANGPIFKNSEFKMQNKFFFLPNNNILRLHGRNINTITTADSFPQVFTVAVCLYSTYV